MDEKTKEVMGIQSESNGEWQERAKVLCSPDEWRVDVSLSEKLANSLTEEEGDRLKKKVDLVKNAVRYMLAGMVKGTIKYPTDEYDPQRWISHLVAEGADQMNYTVLTAAAVLDALGRKNKVND